jgi:hypothetical protein
MSDAKSEDPWKVTAINHIVQSTPTTNSNQHLSRLLLCWPPGASFPFSGPKVCSAEPGVPIINNSTMVTQASVSLIGGLTPLHVFKRCEELRY